MLPQQIIKNKKIKDKTLLHVYLNLKEDNNFSLKNYPFIHGDTTGSIWQNQIDGTAGEVHLMTRLALLSALFLGFGMNPSAGKTWALLNLSFSRFFPFLLILYFVFGFVLNKANKLFPLMVATMISNLILRFDYLEICVCGL